MAASRRTQRRTWITEQLFLRTTTPIYAVEWYEVALGATSEVEVTMHRGRKVVCTIANVHLEEKLVGNALKEWIEAVV